MQGWPGSVLERVTDSVTDNCCLVCVASFAAPSSRLDVFLCIVPCSASIVQDECHQYTGDCGNHKKRCHSFVFQNIPYKNRKCYSNCSGEYHVLQRTLCGDVYTTCVIRLHGSCQNTRVFELPSYINNDILGSFSNCTNCQCREQKDEHGSQHSPAEYRHSCKVYNGESFS